MHIKADPGFAEGCQCGVCPRGMSNGYPGTRAQFKISENRFKCESCDFWKRSNFMRNKGQNRNNSWKGPGTSLTPRSSLGTRVPIGHTPRPNLCITTSSHCCLGCLQGLTQNFLEVEHGKWLVFISFIFLLWGCSVNPPWIRPCTGNERLSICCHFRRHVYAKHKGCLYM